MKRIEFTKIGQIDNASIEFGDLTVFVGPQGTGKSICLQLIKLIEDTEYVKSIMRSYGATWHENNFQDFLKAYLGDGMQHIWNREDSAMKVDGALRKPSPRMGSDKAFSMPEERIFYIPAQRVLSMPSGWPQPFSAYSVKDPFVVKNFSENIRLYVDKMGRDDNVFPINKKLKEALREKLNQAIFHGSSICQTSVAGQQEIVLNVAGDAEKQISYKAWSTGQREFVPLLLGCYQLLTAGKVSKHPTVECVVLEEPEMGLHPQAIYAVMSLVFDMLSRGYRVLISTHSTHILDVLWALNEIRSLDLPGKTSVDFACRLLGLDPKNSGVTNMISLVLGLSMKIFGFSYRGQGVGVTDISTLDPDDEDGQISGWGGLSEYSGRVSEIVAEAIAAGGAR